MAYIILVVYQSGVGGGGICGAFGSVFVVAVSVSIV